ncbi:MAG: hypothetical protein QM523_09310 [Candidatus Pacebacteria bacterium]|nr:hypothetical protein [Candidatus Paceibacterota bacterium]
MIRTVLGFGLLLGLAACSYTDHFTVAHHGRQIFYNNVGDLTGQKSMIGKPSQLCGSPLMVESVTTSYYTGLVILKYPIIRPEYNYTITCKDEKYIKTTPTLRPTASDNLNEEEPED